uniref:Uncharacterized protein n=1 Tax=Solanum tuberosum TaxID=4113 RepID=M1DMG6_SOLTU
MAAKTPLHAKERTSVAGHPGIRQAKIRRVVRMVKGEIINQPEGAITLQRNSRFLSVGLILHAGLSFHYSVLCKVENTASEEQSTEVTENGEKMIKNGPQYRLELKDNRNHRRDEDGFSNCLILLAKNLTENTIRRTSRKLRLRSAVNGTKRMRQRHGCKGTNSM